MRLIVVYVLLFDVIVYVCYCLCMVLFFLCLLLFMFVIVLLFYVCFIPTVFEASGAPRGHEAMIMTNVLWDAEAPQRCNSFLLKPGEKEPWRSAKVKEHSGCPGNPFPIELERPSCFTDPNLPSGRTPVAPRELEPRGANASIPDLSYVSVCVWVCVCVCVCVGLPSFAISLKSNPLMRIHSKTSMLKCLPRGC